MSKRESREILSTVRGPDHWARLFFGSNAFLAVMVLALITLFIAREAFFFFPQYHRELVQGRQCGLELAERMRKELSALAEPVQALRAAEAHLRQETVAGAQRMAGELADSADAMEERVLAGIDFLVERQAEARTWRQELAGLDADSAERRQVAGQIRSWEAATTSAFLSEMENLGNDLRSEAESLQARLWLDHERGRTLVGEISIPRPAAFEAPPGEEMQKYLEAGAVDRAVPFADAVGAFLSGKRWVTNSFNRELYGLLPLLSGTLLVSMIAAVLAVPLGLASACYVNQFATARERTLLKPVLEFMAAFPTVLLGFLGVVFWGDIVQALSQIPLLEFVPGFPLNDRLNALTAGTLLALVAIPVIFTLAEDALDGVSGEFTEASFSVGATRVQTLLRVVLPAASPGLLSAVLLGFGRIMGETMIVLLVAGNRIQIPEWGDGNVPVFQPVHTMTGIIAQEMGEVSFGSLHYRALFVVAALLFLLALSINHLARELTRPMRQRARSSLS